MQIHKLEDYLQIQIFDRNKSPVEPTPMGKKVLAYARNVMQQSNALEELARSLRGEVAGEFILAVIPTLAPYVLPLFVSEFVEKYPKVELKIFEYQTDEIIRYLKEGKVDGAILATPLEVKELMEEHLFFEPFKLFFHSGHALLKKKALDEKELDLSEAWLLKEGHCMRAQALHLCSLKKEGTAKNLFFEGGSLETLINMVKSTRGFTVLPYLATLNLGKSDRELLRDFKGHDPVRNISFVTGPLSMKTSIKDALIKVITSKIPRELKRPGSKSEVIAIR
jgi:LysR family hydrogen peroxide-inducible transcriptional activator